MCVFCEAVHGCGIAQTKISCGSMLAAEDAKAEDAKRTHKLQGDWSKDQAGDLNREPFYDRRSPSWHSSWR